MTKKILIGGIGSVLLGDDGVGPYIARLLESSYRFDEGVTIADLGTPGLDLVAHLCGQDALILIDSVANGATPGTVTLYERSEIMRNGPTPVRMDPHSPALSESLLIAELAGPAPENVLLIGITGAQYEIGAGLSKPVRRAVPEAIREVLRQLNRLGCTGWREHSGPESIPWWETSPTRDEPALTGTSAWISAAPAMVPVQALCPAVAARARTSRSATNQSSLSSPGVAPRSR